MRRSIQERRQRDRYTPPNFHYSFVLSIIDDDPRTDNDRVDSKDSKLKKKVTVEEMDALDKNEAWDLVELPIVIKPIGNKWLYKKKLTTKGKVEKYKACLVANGYSQLEGIVFGEFFLMLLKSLLLYVFCLLLLLLILK